MGESWGHAIRLPTEPELGSWKEPLAVSSARLGIAASDLWNEIAKTLPIIGKHRR